LLQQAHKLDIEPPVAYLAPSIETRLVREGGASLEDGDRVRRKNGLEGRILLQPSGELRTTVAIAEKGVLRDSAPGA